MVATNHHLQDLATRRRDRITRASRVNLLRRKVAAGEYVVDPDRLAEVLVERARFHRQVKADLLAHRSPSEL